MRFFLTQRPGSRSSLGHPVPFPRVAPHTSGVLLAALSKPGRAWHSGGRRNRSGECPCLTDTWYGSCPLHCHPHSIGGNFLTCPHLRTSSTGKCPLQVGTHVTAKTLSLWREIWGESHAGVRGGPEPVCSPLDPLCLAPSGFSADVCGPEESRTAWTRAGVARLGG